MRPSAVHDSHQAENDQADNDRKGEKGDRLEADSPEIGTGIPEPQDCSEHHDSHHIIDDGGTHDRGPGFSGNLSQLLQDLDCDADRCSSKYGSYKDSLDKSFCSRCRKTIEAHIQKASEDKGDHNTRSRYAKLKEEIARDPCGRVAKVRQELEWLLSVEDEACKLTDLYEEGKLPLRVTHNDTKINNVLFDEETLRPLVVIDLDTVMPGLVGHDFGDAIRFAANFVEEDCPKADEAGLNLNVYWAFAEGFLKETAPTLTEMEVETLGNSCFTLTCELATRFLADYLVGDKYFKVNGPEHNLIRTRCQIALAKDMQTKMDAMNAIVRDCWQRYRK